MCIYSPCNINNLNNNLVLNNNMLIATGYNDYFLNFITYENIKVAIYKNIPLNLLEKNIICLDWDISASPSFYYCIKDHSLSNLALSFDQILYEQLNITIN